MRVDLLINDQDIQGPAYLEVMDPGRTTDLVGHVARASAVQAGDAIQAAHAAFEAWSQTAVAQGVSLLHRAAGVLDVLEKAIATVRCTRGSTMRAA